MGARRLPRRHYQVWTLRGSSVIRIESIREREEALAAVGLREWPVSRPAGE
jgi:hypothetical protein